MLKPAKCHPYKNELFSRRYCKPWERGLCGDCHARAREARDVQRERVRARLERSGKVSEARVVQRGRRERAPGVSSIEWATILSKFKWRCGYCSKQSKKLEINFLVPPARGGLSHPNNVLPACPRCAHSKGKRLITEWPSAGALVRPEWLAVLTRYTLAYASEV